MGPIYISATLQDCGKTSVSLGLMQVLHDQGKDPGYCKPVGQHYVRYQDHNIDEDGVLMHQVFNLPDQPYFLSPIAIERGFTRKFIFNPDVEPLEKEILRCRDEILKRHPMIIIEGTGHAGVGSCFGLSNARVAQILGAKVVIVTSGGIGKPIDEIAQSLALFHDHDVNVLGVILNKVLASKYDKVRETVTKGLTHLGTQLIGAIPYDPTLMYFTVGQVAEEFGFNVLCGTDNLSNYIKQTVIAAMEPQHVIRFIKENSLVIMPGDRVDNMLISILALSEKGNASGGLILTGGFEPDPQLIPLLKRSGIPTLLTEQDTYSVTSKMSDIGFKIRSYDHQKIEKLHQLVRENVDLDIILNS